MGAGKLRKHVLPTVSIVVCLLVGWWIVTGGTGHPFKPYDLVLGSFYDAQAEAILSGRIDVPCSVIRNEAFTVNGRCYGYFGVTPSLFRLPLNALFPANRAHWATLSISAAYALFLASAYAMSVIIQRRVFPLSVANGVFTWLTAIFLLALGLGSTSIFLMSRPVVHHEALMWSSALGLCSLLFVARHVFFGDRWALGLALVLSLLAIHARPPAGLTAAAACAIGAVARVLLFETQSAKKNFPGTLRLLFRSSSAPIAILAAGLVVASYGAMNFAKFGTMEGHPVRYYVSANPTLGERMFFIENIRWNLSNQFGLEGLAVSRNPPFVTAQIRMPAETPHDHAKSRYPEARIGGIEPYISIAVGMSGLLALSFVGIVGVLRGPSRGVLLALALPTMIGPIVILTFAFVSYRLFHEYAMFFALTGAVAVSHLAERTRAVGVASAILLAILVMGNVLMNVSFAIRYQTSETNLGPPVREMTEAIERLQRFPGRGP